MIWFLNLGFDVHVVSYSARAQVIIALVFGYMVYTGMSAVLVSELAVSELQMPIKSLDDVVNKGKWSLCVRRDSFVNEILMVSSYNQVPQIGIVVNRAILLTANKLPNWNENRLNLRSAYFWKPTNIYLTFPVTVILSVCIQELFNIVTKILLDDYV